MNVFIGLDVSLASTAVCVLGERGRIVQEAQVDSEPEALARFLRELDHAIVVVGLEAGPLSQWLHKGLSDAGFATVLMETRQVKSALQAMPIKTDRRDAEGIARLLQMGWFRPVHCKSVSAQEMRALLGSRKAVQNAAVQLELSVRGMLRNFGLKMGKVSKGRFEARVRELAEGNAMLEAAVMPLLKSRRALRDELAQLEKLVRDLAAKDPVCQLMMSMPGVGGVIALTVRAAIDDPERFRSSKDIGPWAGLTPKRSQSGERDIVGAITRAGGRRLAHRPLPGGHGDAGKGRQELVDGLGAAGGAAARQEAGDSGAGPAHRHRSASHVARRHAIPLHQRHVRRRIGVEDGVSTTGGLPEATVSRVPTGTWSPMMPGTSQCRTLAVRARKSDRHAGTAFGQGIKWRPLRRPRTEASSRTGITDRNRPEPRKPKHNRQRAWPDEMKSGQAPQHLPRDIRCPALFFAARSGLTAGAPLQKLVRQRVVREVTRQRPMQSRRIGAFQIILYGAACYTEHVRDLPDARSVSCKTQHMS